MQGSVEPIIQRLLRWPGLITLGTQLLLDIKESLFAEKLV